jgi:hypothetical protein
LSCRFSNSGIGILKAFEMQSNKSAKEVQDAIINAIKFFPLDLSLPYQSISFVGLRQMRRDIPWIEMYTVLKSMEGVKILDTSPQIQIPSSYFI